MKTRKQNRRTRDCAADTKSSVWLSCARKELLPKEPWDSNTPCSELNCYPLVSLTKEQEQLRLILEAAYRADPKPAYEIRRKLANSRGMYSKRLLDDGGYSRDSSNPFGKLYEKGGGEESSRFTRQINTVLGQPSSIS